MNREKESIARDLVANVQAIDKALDVLADHRVTTYVSMQLQEILFDSVLSKSQFGEVENRSDFLAGVNAAFSRLNSLPDALKNVTK